MAGPIRIVAFDFDGTVVDSMGGFADLASELLAREHGVTRAEGRGMYLRTSGLPFSEQLEELFPGDRRNRRLALEFEERKLAGFHARTYFPDVKPGLDFLRSLGLKLAVCSNNSQENVDTFVEAHREPTGVTFDHVLGLRPGGFVKGRPHFDHLLAAEQATKDNLLLVGDSLKDVKKARAYGIRFLGRLGTFSNADFHLHFPGVPVVRSFHELRSLFKAPGPP
jgi:phosphoglycolate phosphatase-like HAD superfamily hydrolase